MKILVAVKRVVDAKIKVRPLPDHYGEDVKFAKMVMNPNDDLDSQAKRPSRCARLASPTKSLP